MSGGRVLVWLLVLSHVFAFQTACTEGDDESDSSGEGGGGCNSGDDTGAGNDDNGGGGCNVQTDVAYTDPPSSDPCTNGNLADCSSGQVAVYCASGQPPSTWYGAFPGSCRLAGTGGPGEYCCATTLPTVPDPSPPFGSPSGAVPSPDFNPYLSNRSDGQEGGDAENSAGEDAGSDGGPGIPVIATCDAGGDAEPEGPDGGTQPAEPHAGDFEAGD